MGWALGVLWEMGMERLAKKRLQSELKSGYLKKRFLILDFWPWDN